MLCNTLEGWNGRGVGVRFQREGMCVCLGLIHVDVWQKPSLEYKVIILQLKIKNKVYIQQGPAVVHRENCSVFCNNLSGKRFEKE